MSKNRLNSGSVNLLCSQMMAVLCDVESVFWYIFTDVSEVLEDDHLHTRRFEDLKSPALLLTYVKYK